MNLGDYKVTLNKLIQCDKYPVPRTEDLLATLNGAERFSKLDLGHAYQQLVLYKRCNKYLTVNTHKDLLQSTHLQYGMNMIKNVGHINTLNIVQTSFSVFLRVSVPYYLSDQTLEKVTLKICSKSN